MGVQDVFKTYVWSRHGMDSHLLFRRCSNCARRTLCYARTARTPFGMISPIGCLVSSTHLFKAIDNKTLCFHDGSDLSSQCAEQLPRLLFRLWICHFQRSNEVDVRVRVRFLLIEPDMDHGQQKQRRATNTEAASVDVDVDVEGVWERSRTRDGARRVPRRAGVTGRDWSARSAIIARRLASAEIERASACARPEPCHSRLDPSAPRTFACYLTI